MCSYLLLVTRKGFYKRVSEASISLQSRGATGQRCFTAGARPNPAISHCTVGAPQQQLQQDRGSSDSVAAATECRDGDWILFIWRDGRCLALPGSHLQRHGLKTTASFVAVGASKRGVQPAATAAAAGPANAASAARTGSDSEIEGHLGCVVRVGKEEIGGQLVVATRQGLVKALSLGLLLPTGTKRKNRTRRLLPLGLGDAVAACAVVKKRPTKSDRDAQAIKEETDTDLGTSPETEARNGVHDGPNKSAESQEQTETLGEAKGEKDYSVVLGRKTLLEFAFSLCLLPFQR